jgi:hypothetical protein
MPLNEWFGWTSADMITVAILIFIAWLLTDIRSILRKRP